MFKKDNKVTPTESNPPALTLFVTFQKGQRKVKVKTIGLVHNYIILGNSWKTLLKVNVKRLNELWCPQSDSHSWYNVKKL